MNLWQTFDRTKTEYQDMGISMRYQAGIDEDMKKEFVRFTGWLRKHYVFPYRLKVRIQNEKTVFLRNGREVYGAFRWYPKRNPSIRVPVKIDEALLDEYTKDEIIFETLSSFVHELSHYYQWVLKLEQSSAASERQANHYRYRIIDESMK